MSIRALRQEAGKTQREVAVAIGVGERVYTRWESGENLPDSTNLVRLLDFFRRALRRPRLDVRDLIDVPPAAGLVAPEVR